MSELFNELGQPIGFPLPNWQPPPFPARETLRGRFCQLEPLNPKKHALDLHYAFSTEPDPGQWTYLPYGPFPNLKAYQDWVQHASVQEDPLLFAIVDFRELKALGIAGYLRIAPEHGSIEVGHLAYAPTLRRTAAATEAMFLLMELAFGLGYRRYEWKCDSLNANSCRAAQRLGFKFEGTFRQATVYKGRNRDTSWFSIIDSEWPALRTAFQEWLQPQNFDESGKQRVSLSTITAGLRAKGLPASGERPAPQLN